jgi:hypothetical protein
MVPEPFTGRRWRSIVNELYNRSDEPLSPFEKDLVFARGRCVSRRDPGAPGRPEISFVDFGTRRRFSRDWQRYSTDPSPRSCPISSSELRRPNRRCSTAWSRWALRPTSSPW